MNEFKNKKILVTGGTGSLGKELVWSLLKDEYPEIVRIYDVDETEQFNFQHKLAGYKDRVRFLLGDVRDKDRLNRAAEDIDIIFYTAALKHVMACEYNPFEAVKTNVLGTQNVIDVAIDNNVNKIIFTSSDKAVNPVNTMGATKLLAEKLMTAANYYKGARDCVFSSVRFGNVMGSRGSVIPLFDKQIKSGGPVTITDSTMTRFMMSMDQAVDLVFKSTEIAQGGEVFIFKMPVVNIPEDQTQLKKLYYLCASITKSEKDMRGKTEAVYERDHLSWRNRNSFVSSNKGNKQALITYRKRTYDFSSY